MIWEGTVTGDPHHDFVTFDEILTFWAEERPDQTAFEQDGRITSYAEADALTRRLIALFKSRGLVKGDKIAWLGKNSDRYCLLYMAAARMGAVMVPIGWRLAPPEIAYILSDTGAKLVFAGEEFVDTALAVAADVPEKPAVIEASAALREAAGLDPVPYDPPQPDEPVLQLYTSGTTGNPKGAVLSNANLLGLRNPGNAIGLHWNFYTPGDCMLVAMPCAHIGGTGLVNIGVANGIRCLMQAEFTLWVCWKRSRTGRRTCSSCPPRCKWWCSTRARQRPISRTCAISCTVLHRCRSNCSSRQSAPCPMPTSCKPMA